jgi:hypothetical protein
MSIDNFLTMDDVKWMKGEIDRLTTELAAARAERDRATTLIALHVDGKFGLLDHVQRERDMIRAEHKAIKDALAAAEKEREVLRKGVVEIVAAWDDQLGYTSSYSRRSRALDAARAALADAGVEK